MVDLFSEKRDDLARPPCLTKLLYLTQQDNYLEEAFKMRNLLEEFLRNHDGRPPTILGLREHIFTGRSEAVFKVLAN